tara:strand:+ start:3564 stop:5102 length:1539 start_codon:yes stop_codon:yes gene_type:complete
VELNPLVMLIILDGWGLSEEIQNNAIALAKTPIIDELFETNPWTKIKTSGLSVGLPDGQMGNSEVGHLNLGSGRIVNQDIVRINSSIEENSLHSNSILLNAFQKISSTNSSLHLIGLVSDGGVHSIQDHALSIAKIAKKRGIKNIFVHAFTDGRDTSPKSGIEFIQKFQSTLKKESGGKLASLIGRYYSMDRDLRWERTRRCYELLVEGKGKETEDILDSISSSYNEGVTDEFLEPYLILENSKPVGIIKDNDLVISFNFRSDRMRQLTKALTDPVFDNFKTQKKPSIDYICMTEYNPEFELPVLFPPQKMEGLFCHILEDAGKKCLRIAETEKYPHVTYFFNGGIEKPSEGEKRKMIPSPKVDTYDLMPDMSADGVTDAVIDAILSIEFDCIVLNFANPDMVGHTGDKNAVIKAVEKVDKSLGRILHILKKVNGTALITSDHGNCEQLWDIESNSPHTSHTTNDTPCILISRDNSRTLRDGGSLCDIAPTVLSLMGLSKSSAMTGENLILT